MIIEALTWNGDDSKKKRKKNQDSRKSTQEGGGGQLFRQKLNFEKKIRLYTYSKYGTIYNLGTWLNKVNSPFFVSLPFCMMRRERKENEENHISY